jgi:cytochrome c-type biogenesis protein CcmH/NrfG
VAIRNLTSGNVKYIARAGTSDAVEALVEAMRRHGESPGVQSSACVALYFLTEDNADNKTRALHEGAKGLAEAALRTHPNNKRVDREARDLLRQLR